MSMNENMEVTRKIEPSVTCWNSDQERMDAYLVVMRHHVRTYLEMIRNRVTLNSVYAILDLEKSRDGMTLGWGGTDSVNEQNLFTWAFCADGTVEITFHNLKDITNLYKTEEELA